MIPRLLFQISTYVFVSDEAEVSSVPRLRRSRCGSLQMTGSAPPLSGHALCDHAPISYTHFLVVTVYEVRQGSGILMHQE